MKKRTTIYIEDGLWAAAKVKSIQEGTSITELVSEFLKDYVKGDYEMPTMVTVQDQLGAEIFVDDFGREYMVTDAPEMYTWEPKDKEKVIAWLNSKTEKGVAPDFPEFVKDYGYETVVIDDQEFDYEAVVNLMDDDIREDLHLELAPCPAQKFVDAYIKRHKEKFGEEFVIN